MKKYRVTIEDVAYQVSVEPIDDGAGDGNVGTGLATSAYPAAPGHPPVAPTVSTHPIPPAPRPMISSPVSAAERRITAPLPGNMWKVRVTVNQRVKRGDVLFIIEAMKMENEIFAPCDGTVTSVSVTEGTAVSTGDELCVIQ